MLAERRLVNLLVWSGNSGFDRVFGPEIWTAAENKFQFINVGFKNLEDDSRALNSAVLEHLYNYPRSALQIEYSSRRQLVESLLESYRWTLHQAVIDKYKAEKPRKPRNGNI